MALSPEVFQMQAAGRLVDATKLAEFLSQADGSPVTIDASEAPLLTSLHLQLFLAAEVHWAAKDVPFEITNQTDQFKTCCALLGWQPNS